MNVCDCLAVRVEKCNLPSLTHKRELYMAFSSLFPSGFIVWNCSRFRPWLRNWIQFPHSHGRETPVSLLRGGERRGEIQRNNYNHVFLSTQAQYPADRIRKIPVFIAQELANRRIEGIYMDIKGVFLLCQYLNYCWATVLFGLSLIVWFGKSTKVLGKVLLFMEAMKMNFNFPVPLPSLRTFQHFYCFPQVTRKA